MSRHIHDWHLYAFQEATLVDVGENTKQMIPARFNFVCSGCGSTKHFPPIKDDHKDNRTIIKQPVSPI